MTQWRCVGCETPARLWRGGRVTNPTHAPHAHTLSLTVMPRIEKFIIERVLDAARIEEVVGDFVTLKKKGVRYLGLCPFHDDRHLGSFVVYPKGNCYKCFQCGAKGGVVDFLINHEKLSYPDAIRWLGKKYSIETDMTDFKYTPPPPRPAPPPLEMLELPKYIMAKTLIMGSQSTLAKWINTCINWDTMQRRRVDEVLTAYNVGMSKQGMTVFWLIDDQGRLRTGKMMRYRTDGHREKGDGYNRDWIHSMLSRKRNDSDPWPHPELFNPDKQEMRPCLYGLHLLDAYKRKDIEQDVKIVESEKTALLMAIAYGNHPKQVWMATGGLSYLTRDILKPLIDQRRHIILYPDRDGIDKWREKAELLHYDRVTIDTDPVLKWWQPCDGDKADIADVVVRMLNERKSMHTLTEVQEQIPQSKPLIDLFDLEIAEDYERATH